MIEQGKVNRLTIVKFSSFGLFLADESGEEILLPKKYCEEDMKPGQHIDVFIYRDSEGRKVATTLRPRLLLHEFAQLKVTSVNEVGAFMDWGLEKELLVPFREQKQAMEEGRWYIVYLDLDTKTDRLFASNRVDRYIQNETLSIQEGDSVSLLVQQKTDLGYAVIVNHQHRGLIFQNEIFQEIRVGEILEGYVKKIREDNKIDISLQAQGFQNAIQDNTSLILKKLEENGGTLALSDRSSPEEIMAQLGISKKAFKKAIGGLYKQKKIEIKPEGILFSPKPTS